MTLEEKRNKRIELINKDLELIKKQEELLKKQKEYFQDKIKRINNVDYFTKEEVKEIIEYLVSKVEKKPYSVKKYNMENYSSVNKNLSFEYSFLYLVSEDNEEEAIKEIEDKYITVNEEGKLVIRFDILNNDVSDNYVKLSLYNRFNGWNVSFNKKEEPHTISIDINDDRFNYIYTFIDELLIEKVSRSNLDVPMEGIKIMADNFALKQKQKRRLILESE